MPSLLAYVPGCFAIRVHGRRWLKITKPAKEPSIGWRAVTWTPRLDEAEKWHTRVGAERFTEMLHCPCEIVDIERRSGMTPDTA